MLASYLGRQQCILIPGQVSKYDDPMIVPEKMIWLNHHIASSSRTTTISRITRVDTVFRFPCTHAPDEVEAPTAIALIMYTSLESNIQARTAPAHTLERPQPPESVASLSRRL